MKSPLRCYRLCALLGLATSIAAVAPAQAQELITNGTFADGLTNWTTNSFGGTNSTFGINANGPTDTSAASNNYAFAGGGAFNLLQQNVTVTNGSAYRLTFLAGSKSGQGATFGILSLRQEALANYNSASFDYRPSDAVFGSYTLDFVAGTGTVGVWLRNDGGGYAAYDNVSVTPVAGVVHALNYSAASGISEITSALSGSGKVTVNAGTGGLTLSGTNTYTGGTEVTGGKLFVVAGGALGDPAGTITINGTGAGLATIDLRNQQTRTGTITMTGENARLISGDTNNPGSLVNNGGAFEFDGGSLEVPLSGSGGLNVTGAGQITSSNSFTGDITISGTAGWYGTQTFYISNTNAFGVDSNNLTISAGWVSLKTNTITRSGNLTINDGWVHTGTFDKSGTAYDIRGGSIDATLAGTAGLTKSGTNTAALSASNSYSGNTDIQNGSLLLSGAGRLGEAAVTISNGASLAWTNAATYIMSNSIAGEGALEMHSGQVRFTGDVTSTGGLTINGGILRIGNNGTTGSYSGDTLVNSGATLAFDRSDALTYGGVISGSGFLSKVSSGVTYLTGNSTNFSGTLTIFANAVRIGNSGTTGAFSGSTVLDSGGVELVFDRSDAYTHTGSISGSGKVVKVAAGTTTVTASNSYTGATQLYTGTLVASNANAFGNGDITFLTGGGNTGTIRYTAASAGTDWSSRCKNSTGTIRLDTDTNNVTLAGAIDSSNVGGLVKSGAGVLTMSGSNSYVGTTTVAAGALIIVRTGLTASIQSNSVAVAFSSTPTNGTYAVLPGPVGSASFASNSVTGLGGKTAAMTNAPNLAVIVSGAASNNYSTWLNGQPPSAANQLAYAIGGASSPTATDGIPSVTTLTSSNLSITAIVRTNDPNLTVFGQATTDLSLGPWSTNGVTKTNAADQSGVPSGTARQIFSTERGTNSRLFLRINTTLLP